MWVILVLLNDYVWNYATEMKATFLKIFFYPPLPGVPINLQGAVCINCRAQCFLQLSDRTAAERAHHEATLAFISMIDDTRMETALEKSPLPRENWWLFGLFLSPWRYPPCRERFTLHFIAERRHKHCCSHIQTQKPTTSHIVCTFIANILMLVEGNGET